MKGSAIGYIIGLVIGIPLFALGVNHFFFTGNGATNLEVEQYLMHSKQETFTVNGWLKKGKQQYIVGFQRGVNSAFLKWFTFYDSHHQKYFNLYVFDYLEENQQGRLRIDFLYEVNNTTRFIAYVNQDQLKNKKYGTKENPVPVWGKNLLEFNGKLNENIELKAKTFHVSPETNEIFIQQYLSRFMPKDEYKVMFKK